MSDFVRRYGAWAVIAGASEGMGAAFAEQAAARGLKVLLIARRADVTQSLALEITREFGVEAQAVAIDLSAQNAAQLVIDAVGERECGFFVYNAAYSPIGPFVEHAPDEALKAIDLNVRNATLLTHFFARRFSAQGRGALVLLSSLTAFQGSPYVATYGATKSYLLSLAEGLWFELRGRDVDVLGVCAGATRTPNLLKAAPKGAPGMLEPEQVVRETLEALRHGPLLIPGRFNRFASFLMRHLLPRRLTIGIMGAQTRKLQQ